MILAGLVDRRGDSTPPGPRIDEAALAVLDVIPTPVSIFDPATLHFLAVNAATAQELARGIDELLQMSIAELRPPEDVEALHDAVAAITAPVTDAGHGACARGDGGLDRGRHPVAPA